MLLGPIFCISNIRVVCCFQQHIFCCSKKCICVYHCRYSVKLLLLLLLLLAMASFDSLDNETYSVARKLDDQWLASISPVDFFIKNEGSLTMMKDMLIQQISLQRLRCICVHFKIAETKQR